MKIIQVKETAERLNTLAREQLKLKLLADIKMDIMICQLEGRDYKVYIEELVNLLQNIKINYENKTTIPMYE